MPTDLLDDAIEVADGTFDRLTVGTPDGDVTTFRGPLPYRMDGFSFEVCTDQPSRTRHAVTHDRLGRVRVVGVTDGTQRGRGVVTEFEQRRGLAELTVDPPTRRPDTDKRGQRP
jgi:hypothetical protein